MENHASLLRVVARGAGPAAPPILAALEGLPDIRERTAELVRIGDRRWDLHLTSGAVVALPEEGSLAALAQLQRLHNNMLCSIARLNASICARLAASRFVFIPPSSGPLLGGV